MRLGHLRMRAARGGGPWATIRDDRQLLQVVGGSGVPVLQLYNGAGKRLAGVALAGLAKVVDFGWTAQDELLVVCSDASVHIFTAVGERSLERGIDFGEAFGEEGIAQAAVFPDGLLVLTGDLRLFCVDDLEHPKPVELENPGLGEAPACMAVIEAQFTATRSTLAILAPREGGLLLVGRGSVEPHYAERGVFTRVSVSPNGQLVAACTGNRRLTVFSSDFTEVYTEVALEEEGEVEALTWCGADLLLVGTEDALLLVGALGDVEHLETDGPVKTFPEVDGARLIGEGSHEFVRKVPKSLIDLHKPGSTAAVALLYDAKRLFDRQDPASDDMLRALGPGLKGAVGLLQDAAGHELDPAEQVRILRAAAFGSAHCASPPADRDRTKHLAHTLRALHAVRDPDCGVFMTHEQLKMLSVSALIHRLCSMHRHMLAFHVAQWVGVGATKVVREWASAKMAHSQDAPDEALCEAIVRKASAVAGVSFAALASAAHNLGRRQLASMLLEHEKRPAEQVPLLSDFGEHERALAKATQSGDSSLVYLVLFKALQAMPLPEFLAMLQGKHAARLLFYAWSRRTDKELLKTAYFQSGQPQKVAELELRDGLQAAQSLLTGALVQGGFDAGARALERSGELFAQSRDHAASSRACADCVKLLRAQRSLEERMSQSGIYGTSLAKTLSSCMVLGNQKAIQQLKTDFKMQDKHMWYVKLRTLGAAQDWEGVASLAREKRSPIPASAFVNLCLRLDAPAAATARCVQTLPEARERAAHLRDLGMLEAAAEAAAAAKDVDMLGQLRGMAGNSVMVGNFIDSLAAKFPRGQIRGSEAGKGV